MWVVQYADPLGHHTEHAADPDELVGCKRCHRPTSAGVARKNDGRCANCHRDTGQEA